MESPHGHGDKINALGLIFSISCYNNLTSEKYPVHNLPGFRLFTDVNAH